MDFIDLKSQQKRIRAGVDERFRTILDHGAYILGPEIKEMEQALANYVGVKHCISCASGTDALLMPLMALGIGRGDAVFVPAFTFVATAEVVSLLGATPIFVDVEPQYFNIDCKSLLSAIEEVGRSRPDLIPRAIIAVDLFGQCADYAELNEISASHGLILLQDAAQSFGATYTSMKACALAPIAATSFFPAKPLGCYGDGGAIFCNNDDLAACLLSIRVHGQGVDKYDNVRVGINGRMDTLQAAVILEKLTIFDDELKRRSEAAERYNELLSGHIELPSLAPERTSSWAQYTLRTPKREAVLQALREAGIPTAIYYPKPLHHQQAFGLAVGETAVPLPVSEDLAGKVFSIPMHPYLLASDQEKIADCIIKAL